MTSNAPSPARANQRPAGTLFTKRLTTRGTPRARSGVGGAARRERAGEAEARFAGGAAGPTPSAALLAGSSATADARRGARCAARALRARLECERLLNLVRRPAAWARSKPVVADRRARGRESTGAGAAVRARPRPGRVAVAFEPDRRTLCRLTGFFMW